MQVDIAHRPASAIAYCRLEAGEAVRAEPGSMAAMSTAIDVRVDAGPGGITKGLLRKALVGESFFMTRFTAQAHGAWVALAAPYPGDIVALDLRGSRETPGIVTEAGSLLGLSYSLSADVRWSGVGAFVMREGAAMIRLRGTGTAVICAYGGIEEFELEQGQELIFDTGHVVAFTEGMKMTVGPLRDVATAELSGEGLVAKVSGPGRVWVQTRSVVEAGKWLLPDKTPRGR